MRTLFIVIAIAAISAIIFNITSYAHTSTVSATVTSKERVVQSNGDGKVDSFYLVYTDKGTMKLEDDVLRGNWYSSDVYGRLQEGTTYTFTTLGYRFGFFSMYPNIIEVK